MTKNKAHKCRTIYAPRATGAGILSEDAIILCVSTGYENKELQVVRLCTTNCPRLCPISLFGENDPPTEFPFRRNYSFSRDCGIRMTAPITDHKSEISNLK
jgi:hypothetical protein